jgi:hypothetical protein
MATCCVKYYSIPGTVWYTVKMAACWMKHAVLICWRNLVDTMRKKWPPAEWSSSILLAQYKGYSAKKMDACWMKQFWFADAIQWIQFEKMAACWMKQFSFAGAIQWIKYEKNGRLLSEAVLIWWHSTVDTVRKKWLPAVSGSPPFLALNKMDACRTLHYCSPGRRRRWPPVAWNKPGKRAGLRAYHATSEIPVRARQGFWLVIAMYLYLQAVLCCLKADQPRRGWCTPPGCTHSPAHIRAKEY